MTATTHKTTKNRAAINRAVFSIIYAMPVGLTFTFHDLRRRATVVVERDVQVSDAALHDNLREMVEGPAPLLARPKKGTYIRIQPPAVEPQVAQPQTPLPLGEEGRTPWEILTALEARMASLEAAMHGLLEEWKGGPK